MSFVDKRHYQGKIVRQEMVSDRNQNPILNLYILLEGMMVDSRRPEAGLLDCPKVEVMVSLRFSPDTPDAMEYSISDLQTLGFDDEDLSKLSEDHPRHFSLVGKSVYVMPTTRVYNEIPQTYWNLRFPKQREDKPLSSKDIKSSPAAEAYRELIKQSRNKVRRTPF